jgi:4-diphosphocytidyl-2-C-methyl-D-erythritol kinase
MIVFPNAKINIGLHVVSRRPDGYHNLETIFYPIKLSDALEMAETGKTGITFSGLHIDGEPHENLVIKAYELLRKDFGLPAVQFHLHKVIPTGAGLGGGSSDAAFALKMLNTYFNLNLSLEKLKQYAVKLGADCSFFIENKPAFAEGIGDKLFPLELDLSGYEIVILKPDVSVSTIQAYKNVVPAIPAFSLNELPGVPVASWRDLVANDFEKSIFPQFPEIKKWKDWLYDSGAIYASMSGSGSAVFGIFHNLPTDLENKIPSGIFFSR